MQELFNKIQELRDLIKAVAPKLAGPKAPSLPKITHPPQPSMTASSAQTKIPGMNPDSKKDPKKIAEQIKSGAIRKPALIKFDSNGQWSLDKSDEPHYHIKVDGHQVTDKPLPLSRINYYHGGVKGIESRPGHVLVPAEKPKSV